MATGKVLSFRATEMVEFETLSVLFIRGVQSRLR